MADGMATRYDSDSAALDAADPLAAFRDRFVFSDPGLVYLDGNSLGRLPRATVERLAAVVREEWGAELIRGWTTGSTSLAGSATCSRRRSSAHGRAR